MSHHLHSSLDQPLLYLKGVGPARAKAVEEELKVRTLRELLFHFPFRYVDKTSFTLIKDVVHDQNVLLKGKIISKNIVKTRKRPLLKAILKDSTGFIELLWFQGIKWMDKLVLENTEYIAYGKVTRFKGGFSMAHPELERSDKLNPADLTKMDPVYPSTEKLNKMGFDMRKRRQIIKNALANITERDIPEILPDYMLERLRLVSRLTAIRHIHFPPGERALAEARKRLIFEEVFFFQLRLLHNKELRKVKYKGFPFDSVGTYFNRYYSEKLPFELTKAQKRVMKEIRRDVGSGRQMNRLLQGDVGSGKTVVAVMTALIALDNDFQTVIMAPTEILAQQHYQSVQEHLSGLGIRVAFLSGSIKGNTRKEILRFLKTGDIHILIGTHAVLEDPVQFQNLGLAIFDEQHRFGVMQRSRLWKKSKDHPPHILVMTATPIPRTLALSLYGDLDISVIDELPPGRKKIMTIHKTDRHRPQVISFMRDQISKGHQVYVVYPLIEESATLDLADLQKGYEELLQWFPPESYQISVVHGRMKAQDKEFEMRRFVDKKAQIMVATTVIEVGVNVPNASVMIIENAERFGLAQLHQLRGRVGRGADQSYCILMSGYKLSREAKTRLKTMVETTDGFRIAEADLKLRGPGDIEGTQQSGILDFRIFNIVHDQKVLITARQLAMVILEKDPLLENQFNRPLKARLDRINKGHQDWGRIG